MNKQRFSDSGSDAKVSKEVAALFRKGKDDHSVMNHLRGKYGDSEIVHAIFSSYKERVRYITKKAQKFKQLLFDRYHSLNLPFTELLKKAKKYADKYDLTENEFNHYLNLVLTDKNASPFASLPDTDMAKTLGYSGMLATTDKLFVKDNEMGHLKEILDMYESTKGLHHQVILQSMIYNGFGPEALNGQYDASKHNKYSHIHPIVAMLFLGKFDVLENTMLKSNIGQLVKEKYEGKPISTTQNTELYYNFVTDPYGRSCSTDSTIEDLKNRFQLQTRLWDSVLHLRQGKYYEDNLGEFLGAVDKCRSNLYDSPEFTFVRDEGTILRRLLGAFSFRPTLVSQSRLFGVYSPYGGTNPLTASGISNITRVPMINLRLPYYLKNVQSSSFYQGLRGNQTLNLQSALTQPQWYVENKMIVPKTQDILHSNKVIFFYVNRRFQTIRVDALHSPYRFTSLPPMISGLEKLNPQEIEIPQTLTFLDNEYSMASALEARTVASNDANIQNMIVGSVAHCHQMRAGEGCGQQVVGYDPVVNLAVGSNPSDPNCVESLNVKAFTSTTPVGYGSVDSSYENLKKFGVLFMYTSVGETPTVIQV